MRDASGMMQLHLCDGQQTHAEIVYDGEQCPRGCPLCELMDEVDLLHKRVDGLEMELASRQAEQQADLKRD